jgi:hypothetical protein
MPALSAPSQDEAIEVASVTWPAAITVVAPSDPGELGTIYFGSREGASFGGPR